MLQQLWSINVDSRCSFMLDPKFMFWIQFLLFFLEYYLYFHGSDVSILLIAEMVLCGRKFIFENLFDFVWLGTKIIFQHSVLVHGILYVHSDFWGSCGPWIHVQHYHTRISCIFSKEAPGFFNFDIPTFLPDHNMNIVVASANTRFIKSSDSESI